MPLIHVNGIDLYVETEGEGPPLLLLHGFTGSTATWRALIPAFRQSFQTIAVDLIGHGRSSAPHDADRYRMDLCIADLLALLDALGVAETAVIGYSMGGRTALHLAAAAPERVRALVLEGASPGIADPKEREQRRQADEVLARRIETEGMEAFVRHWENLPLFATQKALPPEVRETLRRQRLQQRPHGLAGSLRGMGTGVMEPLHDRLASLPMPVLLIAGEHDEKYRAIAHAMAKALPRAQTAIIPGAGHNVHLEKPEAFGACVMNFLLEHGRGPSAGAAGR